MDNTKRQPSPLVQGVLDILIRIKTVWDNDSYDQVHKEEVSTINFKCYEDKSNDIRQSMKAIKAEETDSDETDNETKTVVSIVLLRARE